jgi:hypothetical protein
METQVCKQIIESKGLPAFYYVRVVRRQDGGLICGRLNGISATGINILPSGGVEMLKVGRSGWSNDGMTSRNPGKDPVAISIAVKQL